MTNILKTPQTSRNPGKSGTDLREIRKSQRRNPFGNPEIHESMEISKSRKSGKSGNLIRQSIFWPDFLDSSPHFVGTSNTQASPCSSKGVASPKALLLSHYTRSSSSSGPHHCFRAHGNWYLSLTSSSSSSHWAPRAPSCCCVINKSTTAVAMASGKFRFAIDRGGTFTDVFAQTPDGQVRAQSYA